MKAVLLIGGKAERMRPLTSGRPKAMTPLMAQPFLRTQIELLRVAGITDIVLCHAATPRRMAAVFGDGQSLGARLTWSIESRPLGTGGALGLARSRLAEPFVCLNGDILTDLDIRGLADAREAAGPMLTLAVTRVRDASSYGTVRTGSGSTVIGFDEKAAAAGSPGDISLGAYAMTPEIFDLIPPDRPVSLETEVFPAAVASGRRRVTAFRHEGYFTDVGVPARYLQAHRDVLAGRMRIPGMAKPNPGGLIVHPTAAVHPTARLIGPGLLGPGARVAAAATLGPGTVLGRRVRVEKGAVVEDSVLWADTRVGEGAVVRHSVLCANAFIGPDARVERAILGDKSTIAASSALSCPSLTCPT